MSMHSKCISLDFVFAANGCDAYLLCRQQKILPWYLLFHCIHITWLGVRSRSISSHLLTASYAAALAIGTIMVGSRHKTKLMNKKSNPGSNAWDECAWQGHAVKMPGNKNRWQLENRDGMMNGRRRVRVCRFELWTESASLF